MKLGISAGIASLVLQFQVFVTLTLAAIALKERISLAQVAGALLTGVGFTVAAAHIGGEVTAAGLVCVLLAAISWGFANFNSRRLGRVNPLALVVWGSLVVPVPVPMAVASLIFEGIAQSLAQVGTTTLLSALSMLPR